MDAIGGLLLCAWLIACDVALKVLSRVDGCEPKMRIEAHVLEGIWEVPAQCPGRPVAGDAVVLVPAVREYDVFGIFDASAPPGTLQLWGLGVVALVLLATVFGTRWKWRSSGDGLALACLWAGAIVVAGPRLVGTGQTLTELQVVGWPFGVGDVALAWGVLWLGWRVLGELRA